jgi:hypothetical protein
LFLVSFSLCGMMPCQYYHQADNYVPFFMESSMFKITCLGNFRDAQWRTLSSALFFIQLNDSMVGL